MIIRDGDFDDPQVLALLETHLAGMHANSPPGTCYVLDLSGLKRPDIAFYAAWDGDDLLAIGALKALGNTHGELKSMRTAGRHLRRGAGVFMLEHLIATARRRGYRRFGFRDGDPFGDYQASDFNQFLHLDL